ncbi:enoyl-CoA hydratase [Histoplasma capsulatum var. duboisii H88]|uniref:Enoyl-CoA hydratase n=2 Tax=Ajellomyces capsulatus (strain H88) TaxID=544711 RepID=F0UIF9_AJEC8|nr:enoyl-CoA hydratase [Histoplasma capsulatum var. duboisii H88]
MVRAGEKPIICAINSLAYGGGCEIIINTDIIITSKRGAKFALPEVKRGVVALAGGLTRLLQSVGKQRAIEMALTGRVVPVEEAERWGIVNEVVEDGGEADDVDVGERRVVKRAVEVGGRFVANSPDTVIVSRKGIKLGWEGVGAEDASRMLMTDGQGG